jgi:hypothetical protein
VYESTLVGLQGLGQAYGKQSQQARGALDAVLAVVASMVAQLDEAHGQRVAYQVATMGDAPVRSADPAQLAQWKAVTRRSLLGAPPPHAPRAGRPLALPSARGHTRADCPAVSAVRACMQYARTHAARVLASSSPPPRPTPCAEAIPATTSLGAGDDKAAVAAFSSKAAGYGAALILLYFSIAALLAMCNMNIKQDTLLYTRAKVD